MKSIVTLFSLAFVSPFANACPDLTPNVYTELTVPCADALPDFSMAVTLNQAELATGGECRVEPPKGEGYYVVGKDLVLMKDGSAQHIGILLNKPSCYQTDSGDTYYPTWNRVELD